MNVRQYNACAAALGVWLLGCKSTYMVLHVRAPGETDLSDSIVRLIAEDQPVCGGGLLFYGRPDPAGQLRIHTPACGDVQLVVTRPGRSTFVRALDTCAIDSLDVTLDAVHADQGSSGSCEAVAGDFVLAWIGADHDRARSFWLTPEAYEPYARNPASEKPWAIDVAPSVVDGRACHVTVTEFYASACDFGWQLELEQSADRGWGVRALSQRRLGP